ncbi:hypothetical protein [Streptomyces sp. Z26]|nr:hypothetical protein [Streptomyces sp. Z26]
MQVSGQHPVPARRRRSARRADDPDPRAARATDTHRGDGRREATA